MNFPKLLGRYNKSVCLGPIINQQQYTRSNVPIKHGFLEELNSPLSQITGQPASEMQLQQLARFRLKQIDPEQV